MARYLSPSTVALLALVAIYTEGVVPNSGTIPVLSFLVCHLFPDTSSGSATQEGQSRHVVPIQEFERELTKIQSAFPGRTIWDLFLKKVWMLDCSDALDTFISNSKSVLVKSKDEIEREPEEESDSNRMRISRTSPLGAFIRRVHLEYMRLQIHDAIRLWENFVAYRLPTKQTWEKRNPSETRNAVDINLSALNIDSSSKLAQVVYRNLGESDHDEGGFSTFDVERLLEFQVSEMQRLGSRLPDDVRDRLGQISKTRGAKPSLLHYLTFLDSWRAGDYASAFDNLHRYFDYTMQSRDRTFYQYALLNLAILQADFGCHSEAVPAMLEAIATARENKDANCLNFCMSWLYHFGKAFPAEMKEIHNTGMLGSEVEALSFLKAKAKEAEMWSLLSTTLLSEAKLGLQNVCHRMPPHRDLTNNEQGESIATALENIAKASHLNLTKNVTSVVGPTLILRSSICSRVGLSRLAWSSCETFMECYGDEAPMEDKLRCLCRLSNLFAQQGRFREAFDTLSRVDSQTLAVLKNYQFWVFFSGLTKLRRLLHRYDLDAASHILSQLKAQGAPDIENSFNLLMLEIEYLIARHEIPAAISKIAKVFESEDPMTNDVFAQIKLMNLKCIALCRSGNPLQAFTITVRAATMANRSRMLPVLWEATATLAEILLSLSEFTAAQCLLEAILPAVLETLDHALAARIYSLLVDATVGLAGRASDNTVPDNSSPVGKSKAHASSPSPRKREELLNEALDLLESAFDKFEAMEDWKGSMEMMAKRATVFKTLGDDAACEDASSKYLDLQKRWRESLVE